MHYCWFCEIHHKIVQRNTIIKLKLVCPKLFKVKNVHINKCIAFGSYLSMNATHSSWGNLHKNSAFSYE